MIVRLAFILFLAQLLSSALFVNLEPVLFVNEIFSLLGVCFLIRYYQRYLLKPQSMVVLSVSFLYLYGFIYAVFSYFYLKQGSDYEFLRTLPLWYSIGAFYLGVEFSKRCLSLFRKAASITGKLWLPLLALFSSAGGMSTYFVAGLLFLLDRKKIILLIFLSYLFYLWISIDASTTAVLILGLFMLMWLSLYSVKLERYVLLNGWLHAAVFAAAVAYLPSVYDAYFSLYVDGIDVSTSGTSGNSLWRLMFWSYGVVENFFPSPLIGIGFGTPLVDPSSEAFTVLSRVSVDPHIAYTIGMHNGYLLVLERMGLLGIIPMLCINYFLFKSIWKHRLLRNPTVFAFLFAYLAIFFISLVQVVLQTPLYAGTYWILCGLLYGLIRAYTPLKVSLVHQEI